MGEHANFYNSVNGDRKYDADSFTEWLKPFFTTGVLNSNLQVTAGNGDMTINVAPGYSNINGKVKYFENTKTLTLDTSDASLSRIDSIIIRRDDAARDFSIMVLKGSLATNPVAPSPVRANEIYDIVIAQVLIEPATISITQADVTDTRPNSELCGWITGTVKEISFDQITAQWEAYMSEFEQENLEEFNTWFNSIKDTIQSILNDNSVINDSSISNLTTYSSQMINSELDKKASNESVAALSAIQEITLSNTTDTSFDVSLPGITANDAPDLYVKTTHLSTNDEKQKAQEEFNKVIEAVSGTDKISFLLSEPLSQSIVVFVKGK